MPQSAIPLASADAALAMQKLFVELPPSPKLRSIKGNDVAKPQDNRNRLAIGCQLTRQSAALKDFI
jgi:hypothetical protein